MISSEKISNSIICKSELFQSGFEKKSNTKMFKVVLPKHKITPEQQNELNELSLWVLKEINKFEIKVCEDGTFFIYDQDSKQDVPVKRIQVFLLFRNLIKSRGAKLPPSLIEIVCNKLVDFCSKEFVKFSLSKSKDNVLRI